MRFFAALFLPFVALLFAATGISAPLNDNRAQAVELPNSNFVIARGNNVLATIEPGDPLLYPLAVRNVWYRWVSPTTSETTVDVIAGYDCTLAIFQVADNGGLIFLGFDDDSGTGLNSQLVIDAIAGTEYVIAVDGFVTTSQGYFALQIDQDIGDIDDFADAATFGGEEFRAVGNTFGYTTEIGEPVHGGLVLQAGASGWIRWTAPLRYRVTLDTVGSRFDTVLAVYTTDLPGVPPDLPFLRQVAFNNNADIRSLTSRLTFDAESGQTYYFAVTGRLNAGGYFELNLSTETRLPSARPATRSVIVHQGDSAILTATTASSGPGAFVWQRQARGTRTWVDLADGPDYDNTAFRELTVLDAELSNDGDRFRLAITDLAGTSYSAPITLTVTEHPNVAAEILGTVNLNLTTGSTVPAPTNDGSYFALGLPRGLTLNPTTGVISGTVSSTARPGTYLVRYGSTDGTRRNPTQFIVVIEVAPFSEDMTGTFEVLFKANGDSGPAFLKLTITTTGAGRYTGRLFTFDDSRSRAFRGELVLNEGTRTAGPSVPVIVARPAPFGPLEIRFLLREPDPFEFDSQPGLSLSLSDDDMTTDGGKVIVIPRGSLANWAGNYNGFFGSTGVPEPTQIGSYPQGYGYGKAVVARNTGRLILRARLPDHTPFTASAPPLEGVRFLLASRVYSPVGGRVAGDLVFTPDGTDGAYVVRPRPFDAGCVLYWTKPASPRSRGYRDGFGAVRLPVSLSPWTVARNNFTASLLPPESISPIGNASVVLSLLGDGLDNTDDSIRVLPVNLVLSQAGIVTLGANPVGALASEWNLRVNSVTGQFTGSFLIIDPPVPPSIVAPRPRLARIYGTLLQDANREDETLIIGAGYFLYNTFSAGGVATESSGEIELLVDVP